MKFRLYFVALILCCCVSTYAQQPESVFYHIPCYGDVIKKQQVSYKDLGRSGRDVLWDMSDVNFIDNAYTVQYMEGDSTGQVVKGIEHKAIYSYALSSDSLLLTSFENNTTKTLYDRPVMILMEPLTYGTCHEGLLHGYSVDCDNLYMRILGAWLTETDATGMLILPEGDTLRHVTRVHHERILSEHRYSFLHTEDKLKMYIDSIVPFTQDSILSHLQNDSVLIGVINNRWYADGYRYDQHDRLIAEFYGLNGESSPVLCTYTYDDFGRLLRKAVGGETVTYEYNVRDWPTVISSRKFKEYMIYASVPSGVSVAPPNPCYNGNLSGVRYKYGEDIICGFDYTYDNMNRLIKSRYGDNPSMGSGRNNAYTEEFSYDCMGNVTSLTRNGFRDDGTCGVIDELAHFYNGNQLVCVENYQAGAHYTGAFSYQDNDDSGEEYAYDKNGNLVKNLDRNISSIQYNTLNLPTRITTKDQNTYEAEYTYDGQGRKLRATYQKKVMDIVAPARPLTKTLAMSSRFEGLGNSRVRPETIIQDTIIHGVPIADYSEFSQTDYCGNIIYRGNRATVLNAHGYTNIDTDAATGESTATHYYYLKDHLGNNRVVFRDDGLVVQENHYYAYGNLTADCYGTDAQQYKYNGKELDRKLGIDLYDYGARWYDATGRLGFTTIDPLCEEDYGVSPYVYCRDNPINAIDPDGKRPKASEAALMAAYVYGGDVRRYKNQLRQAGWEVSSFPTSIQMNYTRLNQNGLQSVLFQRTVKNVTEYAYVYAGTNSIEDAIEDIAQLAGAAPQYHTAIHNARILSDELGNKELTFVGHSLGGGEAIASSMATGRAAITFNPAAVSKLTKLSEGLNKTPDVVNYRAVGKKIGIGKVRIGGDILNNLQEKIRLYLPGKTIEVPTGIIPTHTINDFLKHKLPEP